MLRSILTTAATLNANGLTDIASTQQAAEALKPIAGEAAFLLFSLGIVGTGLLAVPVLAASAAYAVGVCLSEFVCATHAPAPENSFSPMMPLTISRMQTARTAVAGSL